MAKPLSQRAFTREAGVSHQAISKAVRAAWLHVNRAGKLDPDAPANARWIANHRLGLSGNAGRALRPEMIEVSEAEIAELFEDWDKRFAALAAEVERMIG